ncbi:MAG: hypothetical protein LBH20_07595 [Treponema sp.]|jgi:hypothetical protein|nr:hypothetical protein [Treponema sp.]
MIKLLLIILTIVLSSCGPKLRPALFPVRGTNQALFGLSPDAAEGLLDFSRPKKLEYRFASAPLAPSNTPASLEIEYSFTGERRLVLEAGVHSWVLPPGNKVGGSAFDGIVHYAVPADDSFPEHFSIVPADSEDKNRAEKDSRLQIHSVSFTERWYGFYRLKNAESGVSGGVSASGGAFSERVYVSPFVSQRPEDSAWLIDLPMAAPTAMPVAAGIPAGFFPVLSVSLPSGKETVIDTGGRRFIIFPYPQQINFPAGMIAPGPLVLPGDRIDAFRLVYAPVPSFPAPIAADPGMILAWPPERWRNSRYEVFSWDRFPSLLIFDTADYVVQDRMFKRLAFFVEKAGFQGRLASDEEIAELHGWNAHDYRAEDLARFFQIARTVNFLLLAEERELESILLAAGIIKESGTGIQGGGGGVISISRESEVYLRSLFMAHEGFHGLFFIDEDFRDFSRRRWQQLPAEAKRFIVSYFNFQHYATADEYLLINEFMAHVMQQPVSQAGRYFGQTLPSRIEDGWRRADLPAKDKASGSWPALASAFTREAEAFSAYVGSRWGLAAGRVHLVTVRQP